MGIQLVLFRRSTSFNSLLNSESPRLYRPWVQIYFLNQEIQTQICKNNRFCIKNARVFEKIEKICLFGELNILYSILNKFSLTLSNNIYLLNLALKGLDVTKSKKLDFPLNLLNKEKLDSHFGLSRATSILKRKRFFYQSNLKMNLYSESLKHKDFQKNKTKILSNVNLFKSFFFYFFSKKNKKLRFIRIRLISKARHKPTELALFAFKETNCKSEFLIKNLFYKAWVFNFLQPYFKSFSYFKFITLGNRYKKKTVPSFYNKSLKLPNFPKKIRNNYIVKDYSLFLNLEKIIESLYFEPKFVLYFRCSKNSFAIEKFKTYFNRIHPLNLENYKNIINLTNPKVEFHNSIFLKAREKNGFLFIKKNSLLFFKPQLNGKYINNFYYKQFLINFPPFLLETIESTPNFQQFKQNLFPTLNLDELFKKESILDVNVIFYQVFITIHENLEFLRQSKNYFLLQKLTFQFDSTFRNHLLSKGTFYSTDKTLFYYLSKNKVFSRNKNLKTLCLSQINKAVVLKKKISRYPSELFFLKKENLFFSHEKNLILKKQSQNSRNLSASAILFNKSNQKLFKLKKKILTKCLNSYFCPEKIPTCKLGFATFKCNFDFKFFLFAKDLNLRKRFNLSIYKSKIKGFLILQQIQLIQRLSFYSRFSNFINFKIGLFLKVDSLDYSSCSKKDLVLSISPINKGSYLKIGYLIPINIIDSFYKNLSFSKSNRQTQWLNEYKNLDHLIERIVKLNQSAEPLNLKKSTYLIILPQSLKQLLLVSFKFQLFLEKLRFKYLGSKSNFATHLFQDRRLLQLNLFCLIWVSKEYLHIKIFYILILFLIKNLKINIFKDLVEQKIIKYIRKRSLILFVKDSRLINFLYNSIFFYLFVEKKKKLIRTSFVEKLLKKLSLLIFKIERIQFEKSSSLSYLSYGQSLLLFSKNPSFLSKYNKDYLNIFYNLNLKVKRTNLFYTSSDLRETKRANFNSAFSNVLTNKSSKQFRSVNLNISPGFLFYGFYVVHKFKIASKKKNYQLNRTIQFNKLLNLFFIESRIYNSRLFSCINLKNQFFFFQLFVSPSTLNVRNHTKQIQNLSLKSQGKAQEFFIKELSPIINKWSDYYQFNSTSLKDLDFLLLKRLWSWSLKRHSKMTNSWIKEKYFFSLNNNKSLFSRKIHLQNSLEKSRINVMKFSKIKLVFIVLPKYY